MRIFQRFLFGLREIPIPFFKTLFIVDLRRWHGLNYQNISALCLSKGYKVLFFQRKRVTRLNTDFQRDTITNENYKSIIYHGVPIYEVAIYSICVDLKIFPSELNLNNPDHSDTTIQWYKRSAEVIEDMVSYFNRYHIEKVIILQGHLPEATAARIVAQSRGIGVISFENTFNKTKLIWDDVSGITVNKNLAKNYFWKWERIIDPQIASHSVDKYLRNIKNNKSEEHGSPFRSLSIPKKKKSILFLGQVYTDSSVLFGINDFNNPVTIIYELAEYAKVNDFELIIKLHPKEVSGVDILKRKYDFITYQKIMSQRGLSEVLQSIHSIIDYENQYDTYSLMDRADVCVTINSQAGLEALIKGKDVISCGSASYGGLGFTFDAHNKDMLRFFLDLRLNQEASVIDYKKINKFFYIFDELYCITKNEKEFVTKITGGQR